MWQQHFSHQDSSVNFTKPFSNGFLECRFVQRDLDQIIVYLSSHSGCLQACRFCHLTASKQVDETPVNEVGFVEQINTVLQYWRSKSTGAEKRLNINWMARGEPLNNPSITNNWNSLSKSILEVCPTELRINMNISTIIPKLFKGTLANTFSPGHTPRIYYSLYSLSPIFRKRWIPKAMDPDKALYQLQEFAKNCGGYVILHQTFIEGENDSDRDVELLADYALSIPGAKINIVRYNPYNDKYGNETSRIDDISSALSKKIPTQVVSRVGYDVKASCGMFI